MRLAPLVLAVAPLACAARGGENWYTRSFYLLHEDHHTQGTREVGRDADPAETARLVALSRPDVVQIHAKGNPGWTTYPTKIGYAPPKLRRDVLALWRDLARRGGYHFSVYYNIGRDGVIMERKPAWNRVQADGKPVERALCYHSGVAEQYLWPMIREIMDAYHPEGFWFDGSVFTVRPCYCKKCVARFRHETHLAPPKRPAEPGWDRYHQMQRQIYREFVAKTIAVVHAKDPACLVAFNWAYSLRMPERPPTGLAYLTGDIGNRVEGLSREAHWYDSLDRPFDLMTTVHTLRGRPGAARPVMGAKPAEQIRQEMAVIVANGGRYFAWDNPTPESALHAARHEFLGKVVAPFLRARQRWCLGWRRVPDASLLHTAACHYAVTRRHGASFSPRNNRIEGATDALARLHLNYEMICDARLAAQDICSPLLIVEHPKHLAERTVEGIARWVRSGGKLLATGMAVGRHGELTRLLGVAVATGPKGSEPLRARAGGEERRFTHWLSRLRLAGAEQVLAVRDSADAEHAFLTRHKAGKGEAFYAAVPLLSRHGRDAVPPALLQAVFQAVLPDRQRLLTTAAPETVEVVLRRKASRWAVHLVNMAPGKREVFRAGRRSYRRITDIPPVGPCRVCVRLPARPTAVHVEPGGKRIDGWRYEDGRLRVQTPPFAIHQILVADVPMEGKR